MKVFEDKMMEYISDSVSICLDEVKDVEGLEKIYIMLWIENNSIGAFCNFKVSGEILEKELVPGITFNSSVVLRKLTNNVFGLKNLFENDNRDVPKTFKCEYSYPNGKFNMNMEYEIEYKHKLEHISEHFKRWIETKK